MQRRHFLGGATAAFTPVNPAQAFQTRKPNILLILASRWRAQTLPGSGDVDLVAPHLGRLAKEGVQFHRAYAAPLPLLPPFTTRIGDWDLAIDFIRRRRSEPFYLCQSFELRPGAPVKDRYPPERFHLRENVPEKYAETARLRMVDYYASCSALDDKLGLLLGTLDEANLAGDTLVVFTSQGGEMLGSHGLEGAGLPFEESARIPLLMRYPRLLGRGESSGLLISAADLMPTLLSFAGVEIPAAVQGRDLSQQIFHRNGDHPESVYCYGKLGQEGEWRMLVRGLDKLVVNKRMQVTHLFNLGQDPFENINLAEEASHKRKIDELKAYLLAWRRKVGDGMDPSGLKIRDPGKR